MTIPEEILASCKRNERKGQEVLYKMCFPDLMRILFRYLRVEADAEDVLNKAMFKVFTKVDQFEGTGINFFAWIKKISINEALDFLRSHRSLGQSADVEKLIISDTSRLPEEKEASEMMKYLLDQLPGLTSVVFNMHVIEGYAHAEIAEQLSISVSNSKWHVFSARKQLQKILTQNSSI